MLELSAEARAHRNVLENESEDDVSDDDLTLEKTIILSSGSSGESPQKAHRRSLLPSRSPVKVRELFYITLKTSYTQFSGIEKGQNFSCLCEVR